MDEVIAQYARERNLSLRDALQTFLQIVVLKNITLPEARLMGGTALVLGYSNPRFSEDIDLTQVVHPHLLKPNLTKAAAELEGWLHCKTVLTPPKKNGRTWRLACLRRPSETVQLHIDCQEYPAHTSRPIVLQFPLHPTASFIPTFVFEAEDVEEIMADKVIALACRPYLGGRDLFDLWFHWLKSEEWVSKRDAVSKLILKKLKDRSLASPRFFKLLKERLSFSPPLKRARYEWQRYLPADFQKESVQKAMLQSSKKILEIFK